MKRTFENIVEMEDVKILKYVVLVRIVYLRHARPESEANKVLLYRLYMISRERGFTNDLQGPRRTGLNRNLDYV